MYLFCISFPAFLYITDILWSVRLLLSSLEAQGSQMEMFSQYGSVLESISGVLLFDQRSIRDFIHSGLMYSYRDVAFLDASDGPFVVGGGMHPFAAKGLTPAHAICMKLSDKRRGKWTHVAHFEYKCSGRVSAGWGALSRPPQAIGGVSWWPADCSKWAYTRLWAPAALIERRVSTGVLNEDVLFLHCTKALNQFTQRWKFRHYLLNLRLMGSQVKFLYLELHSKKHHCSIILNNWRRC